MKRNKVLYLEVADKIKKDIFSGKYPVGTMLPTENELEELFGVSKITVRKAIELLAADEYVQKKSGRGTTVLSNRPYNKLSRAVSFTQILKNSNFDVDKVMLNVKEVELKPSDSAYPYIGRRAVCLERLYLLDNEPYIYFVHYLPEDLADISKEQFKGTSLYRLMNQKEYDLASFEDAFEAILLSNEQQEKLQTSEQLGIRRTRKSVDSNGKVVEYSEAIYNTSKHPYYIEYEA
ncbi:GntR family transcriptional regulator [Enterococcus saccharolyticus]|uniref:GntR family transcriptional regulator n=1 Tax=Candidatus Enterococcus willemsii TaxID=1857215 RepID=A0ABQ6Z0I8_9ENTE|nr:MULTISPECIES: GntR family transcriptional regulator [Enterococcus]KAF1304516.1 GntR family transcriptional regulator [Enterococcus sp. CU12B]MCD5001247.1 GntR family transcriptional regulator [Enterococcus saccharolyticus]